MNKKRIEESLADVEQLLRKSVKTEARLLAELARLREDQEMISAWLAQPWWRRMLSSGPSLSQGPAAPLHWAEDDLVGGPVPEGPEATRLYGELGLHRRLEALLGGTGLSFDLGGYPWYLVPVLVAQEHPSAFRDMSVHAGAGFAATTLRWPTDMRAELLGERFGAEVAAMPPTSMVDFLHAGAEEDPEAQPPSRRREHAWLLLTGLGTLRDFEERAFEVLAQYRRSLDSSGLAAEPAPRLMWSQVVPPEEGLFSGTLGHRATWAVSLLAEMQPGEARAIAVEDDFSHCSEDLMAALGAIGTEYADIDMPRDLDE